MTSDSPKVRHKAPNVFDRSTLIENVVTFYVNNKIFDGWKNVKINRTLNAVSGTFSLTILNKSEIDGDKWELKPGQRAHLHLGKNAVFEGYIDNLDISYSSNARNITFQGRDRTADLVDCSALGECEYQNLTLSQIAEKLTEPFGLKVLTLTDIGEAFPTISIKPGEKVFEVLNKLARQRGVLLYSSTHGNLVINKTGTQRATTELIEGVNILSAKSNYNNSDRFNQYIVKAQNDGLIGSSAEDATEGEGKSSDSGIDRYRPLIIIAENAGDSAMAQSRAQWEATFRSAKATTITVTLSDWREKNGDLWDINKLVYLRSKKLGVNDQFLINSVSFSQSENQARLCELELVRKDAYSKKPEVKKDNDPLAGLGI